MQAPLPVPSTRSWRVLAPDVDRRALLAVAALLAVNALAVGALGWQLGRMVDDPSAAAVVVLAGWYAARQASWTAALVVWQPVVERACGRWRVRLLERALHQPVHVLAETSAGELADRIDDDTATTGRTLAHSGLLAASAVATAAVAAAVAGWTAPWAVPGFVVTSVAVVLVTRWLGPRVARRREEVEAAWTDLSIVVEEAVAARDDVRAVGGRRHVLGRYGAACRWVLDRERIAAVGRADLHLAVSAVFATAVSAVVVGSVVANRLGSLTVAQVVTVVTLAFSFAGQLRMVTNNYPQLVEGVAAARRVVALASVPVESGQGEPGRTAAPADGAVVFRGVTFAYGAGLPTVLHDVHLTVRHGRTVGVVGRTGSGKSTLVALLTRQVEPPRGTVLLGGVDVLDLPVTALRRAVGVVSQRTELLAATVAENVTLFADVPARRVEAAFAELGLADWVASLPEGLDTRIGPGGLTLSSGEEQLVAFARLLVRDPLVVVLDEATARMDPVTDARVARAAARLLAGRTGIVIAHRLATLRACHELVVMDDGHVVESGARAALVRAGGPFSALVAASGLDPGWLATDDDPFAAAPPPALERRAPGSADGPLVGAPRAETWDPPVWRTVVRLLRTEPRDGLGSLARWGVVIATGYAGIVANAAWGRAVVDLTADVWPVVPLVVFVVSAAVGLVIERGAHARYPRWWVQGECRLRAAVVAGQVHRYRTRRRPPGEVVARAFGTERVLELCDNAADLVLFLLGAVLPTTLVLGPVAGAITAMVMAVPFTVAVLARGRTGRVAVATADARARSAVLLGSAVDAARSVKLFAAVDDVVHAYGEEDRRRVRAAGREAVHRALLDTSGLTVAAAVVTVWAARSAGLLSLEAALAASATVTAMSYGAWVAQAVVANATAARVWLRQVAPLAQTDDLVTLPAEVRFDDRPAPAPVPPVAVPLQELRVEDLTVVHDDGTVGVRDVAFSVAAGELVLVVGEVGAGKSSLLGALAGLYAHTGRLSWNGTAVDDPEVFLRPGQVAWVGQVPRVLSGTFADNVALGHRYDVDDAVAAACLGPDMTRAGGALAVVGHRGVRLSGGQVQRLALARALAAHTEVVVADDVSSALDAATEVEVWASLRSRGCAVVAASCKLAAVERADRVVVLDAGRQVAVGPWHALADRYGHLVA